MNLKEMAERLEMEEPEFLDMLNLFLETALSDLGHLQSAWEKKDAIGAAIAAHSIKGAAANLGLTEIFEAAKIMEMEARSNRLDRVREWIRILRMEVDRMAEDLGFGEQ